MLANLKHVLVDDDGATLVEYALIVSLIAVACITIITFLSGAIQSSFSHIGASINAS
jgi:pilus assembly protein Flp/PilA